MEIKQAIILAGGLGTRLKDVVADLPKCMAPVAGRPFLFYVINNLRLQGIEHFIFSLGYKHELIEEYLQAQFPTLSYQCSIEEEPLGTGGAIKLACELATEREVLIANGDTLFKINLAELFAFHRKKNAECTLALKSLNDFDRYGVVNTSADGKVIRFQEKKYYKAGNINGGIYLLGKDAFLHNHWAEKFSFEKDYLEKKETGLYGLEQDGYFIDIGIPSDFEKAQADLFNSPLKVESIDNNWTLFLDRDGVINIDKEGSYIFNEDEFVFTEGAPRLFKTLTKKFGRIVVVTNQRGVGRELMTEQTLQAIHKKMREEIEEAGGRIDAIYYCTAINNDHPMRKPNPGMARKATLAFKDIDLSKSIMVGNNPGDMQFGRNAGMYTVFVRSTRPDQDFPHPDIDLIEDTLEEFTQQIEESLQNK